MKRKRIDKKKSETGKRSPWEKSEAIYRQGEMIIFAFAVE